ncbi:putative nuclease HARBI1 [Heterodontus francisci]|uniref:putative nuclease HARBI1 n=1 Tax=Heterodontus francisci TaxID=7792 RepID=UPI00355BF6B5
MGSPHVPLDRQPLKAGGTECGVSDGGRAKKQLCQPVKLHDESSSSRPCQEECTNISVALNFYKSKGHVWGLPGSSLLLHQGGDQCLFKRASDYVCYRTNPDSQTEMPIAGFPQVQGTIDCMHVAIKAPTDQPAAFINRKGFHSINIQLVREVCARFPGSRYDAYLLQQFRLSTRLQGSMIGDKGYLLKIWILKPMRSPHNAAEERYNTCHSSSEQPSSRPLGC